MNQTVEVGKPASGNSAEFVFGTFTFSAEGTYRYTVRENVPSGADSQRKLNGITYSSNEAHITIVVSDNLQGGFTAAVSIDNPEFKNTYDASLDYDMNGNSGLVIVKNLKDHAITGGQFTFNVTAADADSAKKAGCSETKWTVESSEASVYGNSATAVMNVFKVNPEFTLEDVGKTYSYTVTEENDGADGYTYDLGSHEVEITTTDNGNGTLTVTTKVDGTEYKYTTGAVPEKQAQIVFNNTYSAETVINPDDGSAGVRINASKALTNRPMKAGEFTFNVYNSLNKTQPVMTGTNDEQGAVTFSKLTYTIENLWNDVANNIAKVDLSDEKPVFTYQYEVSEVQPGEETGVTANDGVFNIAVRITDNNDGTLSAEVVYPENTDSLDFKNTYGDGEDGKVSLNITGQKILKADGTTNAPDITDQYEFVLSGEEGAPMPENAADPVVTRNDEAYNIDFGNIEFTMDNVFGANVTAERSRTFTYTVSETGMVAGVENDPQTVKTFEITVTDNGDGSISVTPDSAANRFTFTNTYKLKPTDPTDPTDPKDPQNPEGGSWVKISKNLSGRSMSEGEFQFVMNGIAGTPSEGMTTSGTNDANGNVTLGDGVVFTKPGTYQFNIMEVPGVRGGVDYDNTAYRAIAEVTDNGDGTMHVAWSVLDADGKAAEEIAFNNVYTAEEAGGSVIGAAKVLNGRELKEGEFTFEMKDSDGNVVSTVKNAADGTMQFATGSFSQAGTYTYTVSEVKGDDPTITYDGSVYTVTVNVTDDLAGHLSASISITKDGAETDSIVFENTYTEPAKPEETPTPAPEKSDDQELPMTGNWNSPAPYAAAMAVSLAGIAMVLIKRMR